MSSAFERFRVEEAYNWRDDIMEITRRIVHETDEARLNNIAEHFKVDLSEIREFLETKQKQMGKPQTNADRIRAMSNEDLAAWLNEHNAYKSGCYSGKCSDKDCVKCWLDWLKAEGGK